MGKSWKCEDRELHPAPPMDLVQSLPAEVRCITAPAGAAKPQWGEIMQFEIPVYIGDSRVQISPDHRLHFQLLSCSQSVEKPVAELFLPVGSLTEGRVTRMQQMQLPPAIRKAIRIDFPRYKGRQS
eukprot:Skav205357  [mRNA]  locus=scaffold1956:187680:190464:- [translate_table: standard]